MAETINIADMAEKISKELFSWFKWDMAERTNENFKCNSPDEHKTSTHAKVTHPADCVFTYVDPYLKKRILLHTDLKSYAKNSIQRADVRKNLRSLAYSIDCARSSEDWEGIFDKYGGIKDIRGMLFIYNHDNEYHKNFLSLFEPEKHQTIRLDNIGLQQNQQIHLVYPSIINYMLTIKSDSESLHAKGSFPSENYSFYYPDLILTKPIMDKHRRPASIEMISGPYLIIEHDSIKKWSEKENTAVETYGPGYIIYYNRPGETQYEFIYLLDVLSKNQILEGDHTIRLRIAHENYNNNYKENFEKAKTAYGANWGLDTYKMSLMHRIEVDVIETKQKTFCQAKISRGEK